MQTREIISIIKEIDPRLVVFLCHDNADPDSALAAYVFSLFLKRLKPAMEIEIGVSNGISRLTKSLLKIFPIKFTAVPSIEEAELIAIFDTSNLNQLNEFGLKVKMSSSPIIVIDHHSYNQETDLISTKYLINESASSTCEIIYRFFSEADIIPNKIEAQALFLGMAFDTRHFVLANSQTFKIVSDLINSGLDTKETLSYLSLPMTQSERIARLKACQRLEMKKADKWLIAISQVNAYQASVARALIKMGAHIAIVAGTKREELSISLRSCLEFHNETGIHLGRDIAKLTGERLNGVGGGHNISAGVNAMNSPENGLDLSLRILMNQIRHTSS